MAVAEKVRQALELDRLSLPGNPPVVAIEVEEYVDSSGDDALKVWVILPEEYDPLRLAGEDVLGLKSAIRKKLREEQIELYPYIHMVKTSERSEWADEDE